MKELEELRRTVSDFQEAAFLFIETVKAYERELERANERIKEIGNNYMRANHLLGAIRKEAAK